MPSHVERDPSAPKAASSLTSKRRRTPPPRRLTKTRCAESPIRRLQTPGPACVDPTSGREPILVGRISEAVPASASTAQRNPPYAFPRSVVRALLEPPVHVVWRLRLTDAEGTDEVRNAAGKGKACGILRIKALRRGLRLAPQLALIDGQHPPCPQHE